MRVVPVVPVLHVVPVAPVVPMVPVIPVVPMVPVAPVVPVVPVTILNMYHRNHRNHRSHRIHIILFYFCQNTSKLAHLLTQALYTPNQYGFKVSKIFSGKSCLASLFKVIKGKHRFYNGEKHENFEIPFLA